MPHILRCLADMMQEIDISAADAPTSGFTSSPYVCGSQPQNWATLSLMTLTMGPYTQGWARSFVNIYPGTRIWTTKMMRWDISTLA